MTTEADLLRAVCETPDDDAPRLVYADWLEENGRPERAAFIRMQTELATLKDDSPRRRELAFRCRLLLDDHARAWLGPLRAVASDARWARGFVEAVELRPRFSRKQVAALFAAWPVRRLTVPALLRGDVGRVTWVPADNKLEALDLIGCALAPGWLAKLAASEQFPRLRELGLMLTDLTDAAVDLLCSGALFGRLALLRLGGNPLGESARRQLRAHFGDRVTFRQEREPDRLFTVQDDYLIVGWGRDDTQFLLLAGEERQRVALFDHAGDLLRTEERQVDQAGARDYRERDARRERARDAWLAELGYRSATIQVKRFHFPGGAGLADFNWWPHVFERPDDPQREELRQPMRRWLIEGQYRFDFVGDDAWFDRGGEVTDT
jgi:uncharacterized protein (TIGR02996 family)